MKLPPLEYRDRHAVDVLVPGHIEAHSGIRFGQPCVIGTGLECSLAYRVDPEDYGITPEDALLSAAFAAGVEWQRSRKRRARMEAEVAKLYARL